MLPAGEKFKVSEHTAHHEEQKSQYALHYDGFQKQTGWKEG